MEGFVLLDGYITNPTSAPQSGAPNANAVTDEMKKLQAENEELKQLVTKLKKALDDQQTKIMEDQLLADHNSLIEKRENDKIQADYEKYLEKEHKKQLREKENELSDAKDKLAVTEEKCFGLETDFHYAKTNLDEANTKVKELEKKSEKAPISIFVRTMVDNGTIDTKVHSIGIVIGDEHVGNFAACGKGSEHDYDVLPKDERTIRILHCKATSIPERNEYPIFTQPVLCNTFLSQK